jgi:hypothetical protein
MFKDWRVFIFRRNRCSAAPEYARDLKDVGVLVIWSVDYCKMIELGGVARANADSFRATILVCNLKKY